MVIMLMIVPVENGLEAGGLCADPEIDDPDRNSELLHRRGVAVEQRADRDA